MTWKADSLPQISEWSHAASKIPLQGRPPGKGSKLIAASQKQSVKQYQSIKSIKSKQMAKQLIPNQTYGTIVKDYVDHPAKMAQLEQFLQSLPTGESSLSHTIYVNASPYEQLFIYQRLTRAEHRGRQSYEQVHRKYLSERLQLQVEVNPSLFKTLVDAGAPLSKKNAASLRLWMEEKEARKETRPGNKAPTKVADDRGELTHALLQHQSSRKAAFATNKARIDKLHKYGQSTSVTTGESSPITSPEAQSEVAPPDFEPFLTTSDMEFQPRLILRSQSPHDSIAVDTKPGRERDVRPSRLVRQLRRPTMTARRAKAHRARVNAIQSSGKTGSSNSDEESLGLRAEQEAKAFLQHGGQIAGMTVQTTGSPAATENSVGDDEMTVALDMQLDSSVATEV